MVEGGNLALAIDAPSQYPAGVAVTAYLTMTNTSNVNATNLVYTVPAPSESGNYTGVTITPYPNGAGENCTNIAAGKSCTFTADIPAGSKPGSFTVIATPNGAVTTQNSKNSQSAKALKDGSISVTANLGLVEVPNTQNDYYILPNNQTITANSSGSTNVMLSVWIKNTADGLSNLKLVDDKGESLTASLVNKVPTYTQNSILTYSLTIPQGKALQNVQALSNVCTTLNNRDDNANTACSNNATINLATQGHGILTIQPSYTVMNESYNTQVITLTNTGTGNISDISYPDLSGLAQGQFTINQSQSTCTTSLLTGQSCKITVTYTPDTTNSGQITPVFSYDDDNNSATEPKNTLMTIQYLAKTAPSPEPEPATPFSVLDIEPSSVSLTAENPEQIITLTNTPGGDTAGATITNLTLPTLTAPLESVNTTCGSSLAVESSCSYTIKYSSAATANATPLQVTYNNGIDSQNSDIAVDWAPIPINGVLKLTVIGESVILNKESAQIEVSLDGSSNVNNLVVSIMPTDNEQFDVSPESCTLSSANNQCMVSLTTKSPLDGGITKVSAVANNYQDASSNDISMWLAYAYVTNYDDGQIGMFGESSNGQLFTLAAPISSGINSYPTLICTESTNHYVYTSGSTSNAQLMGFSIGNGGILTQLNLGSSANLGNWSYGTQCSTQTNQLYAGNGFPGNKVFSFSIDNSNGSVTLESSIYSLYPYGLSIYSQNGMDKFLYALSNSNGNISGYSIGINGIFSNTIAPVNSGGGQAITTTLDPSNKFLISANGNQKGVYVYQINSQDGSLTLDDTAVAGVGDTTTVGVTSVLHGISTYVYVTDNFYYKVYAYSLNTTTGALTPIANYPSSGAYYITSDPNGNYIYVSNPSGNVNIFAIQNDGSLQNVGATQGLRRSWGVTFAK